ncbi:LysM peptidoglycan-binding domain-containing protein [uncultured Shimia sp.]|uniref:LysM peptidoglycan-binding domain-containing protein n=1 Tax=uncultured Shimia sp. TaxID=573152 RepID=UPI002626A13D|nr:LysM peptidoglycan-binding domain-containing protein [uncultured Shimia sp.]
MSDKASIFSGNVVWVAGVVVAMGVSVFALVSTGVLDGSDQIVDDTTASETTAVAPEATPDVSEQTAEAVSEPEARPAPSETQAQVAEGAEGAAPVAEPEPNQEQVAAALAPVEEEPAPTIAPSFDLVRVDAEGNTVVAGAAAPGAMLGILLDGAEVALAPVDTAGKFAAILAIEPSEAPRVLSLVERRADGDVPSDATVIVAPVVAVAEAVVAPEVVEDPVATDVAEPKVTQANAESEVVTTEVKDAATDDVVAETEETALQVNSDEQPIEEVVESVSEEPVEEAPKPEAKEETTTAVPAPKPKAPAVIVSDSEGVRVVQPAAPKEATPEVLAAVSIDSISYTDAGAVMVSGRGNPSAFVRLYLDNALAATTKIDDAGLWSTQLEDVAGGLYELRADEVDETANVLSRVVTPFKRETPETVAKARAQAEAVAEAETSAQAPETPASVASEDNDVSVGTASETIAVKSAEGTDEDEAAPESAPVVADVSGTGVSVAANQAEIASEKAAEAVQEQPAEEVAQADAAATEPTSVPSETAQAQPEEVTSPEQTTATSEAELEPAGEPEPVTAQPPVRIVTVQPGATLWAIARDRYGEGQLYLQVFEANKDKIRDPDLIYPGQVFSVPEE